MTQTRAAERAAKDRVADAGRTRSGGADCRARLGASRYGTPVVLALTLVLVLVGAYLVKGGSGGAATSAAGSEKVSPVQLQGAPSGSAPEVGKLAPDFTASTVEGTPVTVSGLKGQPVWLTFGASWCSSCRAEFPDVQAAHQVATAAGKAGGLAVVGVHLSEDAATVKEFAGRVGLTYPLIPDPNTTVAVRYRVMGVPAHVFIDRDGVIRSIDMGILGPDQLRDRLTKIGA